MPIYNVEGREREYDDSNDPNQQVAVSPPATPGPTRYTLNNPPPPGWAGPGYEAIYNPELGEFVRVPAGQPYQSADRPGFDYQKQQTAVDRIPMPPGGGAGGGGAGGGYPGGGDFSAGSYLPEGWGWPSYTQPEYLDPGPFDPGPAFTYKDFTAPNAETMLNEPGFQFRMDQGRKALESSAAGRGVLRSGGTLKDILNYGQNFASQEYGNVFNRAAQEYDMNRRNAFDTWNTGYTGRKDAYGFKADNFGQHNLFNQRNSEFDFTGRQRQAELDFQDAYQRWLAEGNWNRDIAIGGAS